MIEEIIKYLILPSNILTLLLASLLFLLILRRNKAIVMVSTMAVTVFFLFGSGPVAHLLLSNLEYRYPPYNIDQQLSDPVTIVVLTGDAEVKPLTPLSSHINTSSAYRLLEVKRIYKNNPEARVIISGMNDTPNLLKQVLLTLDIAESAIQLDNKASNTYNSAVNLAPLLKENNFILVTSAGHMPRAMAVFVAQGLRPIAAPTEFLSQKNIFAAQYLPTSRHLIYADLAMHEYLAILWYGITGKI